MSDERLAYLDAASEDINTDTVQGVIFWEVFDAFKAERQRVKELESERDRLRALVGELAGSLRDYGLHDLNCNTRGFTINTDNDCTCGIAALLVRAEEATK